MLNCVFGQPAELRLAIGKTARAIVRFCQQLSWSDPFRIIASKLCQQSLGILQLAVLKMQLGFLQIGFELLTNSRFAHSGRFWIDVTQLDQMPYRFVVVMQIGQDASFYFSRVA